MNKQANPNLLDNCARKRDKNPEAESDARMEPIRPPNSLSISQHSEGTPDTSPANPISPSTSKSQDNSPTKSARNRRKNEARRRKAQLKNQQHNQVPVTNNEIELETPDESPQSDNRVISEPIVESPVKIDEVETNATKDIQESAKFHDTVNKFEQNISNNRQDTTLDAKHRLEGGDAARSPTHPTNSWRRRQAEMKARDIKELREQLKAQNTHILTLVDQVKQQETKVKELESALLNTTRACKQLDQLLKQELDSRVKLERENDALSQAVNRLKTQLSIHERDKYQHEEMIRVLNATLMERETEVSLLKLKMTRIQTNPGSAALNSANSTNVLKSSQLLDEETLIIAVDPKKSAFSRCNLRSTMTADLRTRSSANELKNNDADQDASLWANIPEDLTPSRRPQLLETTNNIMPSSKQMPSPSAFIRDRRYRTLPKSMKSPPNSCDNDFSNKVKDLKLNELEKCKEPDSTACRVTNLDDTNSTSNSDSCNRSTARSTEHDSKLEAQQSNEIGLPIADSIVDAKPEHNDAQRHLSTNHYSLIPSTQDVSKKPDNTIDESKLPDVNKLDRVEPPCLPPRAPKTPVKFAGLRKIFGVFRRSESADAGNRDDNDVLCSSANTTPFKRGANRSTLAAGKPKDIRAHMSPIRQTMTFQTDKPFDEWDTAMLVDWLTMIGLSMYTDQSRRNSITGGDIMNATPTEVDKFMGITNPLHRKKLRLAISELNGDCDKVTKSAAKLDYLWVARWLDDIGLPQYKESFIEARVDGRVLNYLTIQDLLSMGIKSVLHHASIKCGIKVLRSIDFDLQLLKRRATPEEIEFMNKKKQTISERDPLNETGKFPNASDFTDCSHSSELPLWTCHRVMEWLRLIEFAEFAPNLRGSGVHGGLIAYEDGFNINTMCSLLCIPINRTLLRRHLSTYFIDLVGKELTNRKSDLMKQNGIQLNPTAEIKLPKKSTWSFGKNKTSETTQENMDEYLCPMYPVEPQLISKTSATSTLNTQSRHQKHQVDDLIQPIRLPLPKIPESVNV